jgi:hypothetical protein
MKLKETDIDKCIKVVEEHCGNTEILKATGLNIKFMAEWVSLLKDNIVQALKNLKK